jgi:hypothetical protein
MLKFFKLKKINTLRGKEKMKKRKIKKSFTVYIGKKYLLPTLYYYEEIDNNNYKNTVLKEQIVSILDKKEKTTYTYRQSNVEKCKVIDKPLSDTVEFNEIKNFPLIYREIYIRGFGL